MGKKMGCILSAVLLCGILSGCGTQKKPEVTLNIKTPVFQMEAANDPDTKDVYTFLQLAGEEFAKQYTEADVKVNIYQFDVVHCGEEIEGCFDTKDAVDVLWGDDSFYAYTGRPVPLDDLITEEIRRDIDERYWESGQINGKNYMLPFFSTQVVLCYNKELFRQAGLSQYISDGNVIQNWTLSEWEEILSTLSTNLPDTVYPMMMYAKNFEGDMYIMTLLRGQGSEFFDEEKRFNINTPEGIAGLRAIREGSEKGYFPPNAGNLEMLDCYDLFTNGQLAIYCVDTALQTLYDDAGIDYGFVNFPSADGNGFNLTTVEGFMVFDNGDETRLKAAKDFVRYVYETDWLDYSSGAIPASSRVAEKYADRLENVKKYVDNTSEDNNYTGNNPNWNDVQEAFYLHIQDLLYGEKSLEQIAQELDDDCNAAIEEGYQNISLHE